MSSRAEEESSLFLLGENSIHTTFEDKFALGPVLKEEPKNVPYEWDSLIEHNIMEPPCMCSAQNSSVQQLGLSWAQDDSDDEDESYLLSEFPQRKSQSVLSDTKKTPFPLGRSTNLYYYDVENRDIEEAAERHTDAHEQRDPPPDTKMSEASEDGAKENSEKATGKEKNKPASRKENPKTERKVDTAGNAVDAASKLSVSASELMEKLLLSAASSDIDERRGSTDQAIKKKKPKKDKEPKIVRAKVDKSPMLLEKMNNLNSVLRKLKNERKKKLKKKQSFNIAEHISNDPQLKEDMHRIYSVLKDVLHVKSRSVFQDDDESLDGNESILDTPVDDADYRPDAIDFAIDILGRMLNPVASFFGSISNKVCQQPTTSNNSKKKKLRRQPAKIDGILQKCKAPCVRPTTESPHPGISFSYSLDEEEDEAEPQPRGDLLDYIAAELEGLGVPIGTSHSSFSSGEEEEEEGESENDLTNFMVIGS